MTEQQHPITPPPIVREQWQLESPFKVVSLEREYYMIDRAAQWGADQELEACVEWLGDAPVVYNDNNDLHPGTYLRDARRLPAPSLKEQALEALDRMDQLPTKEDQYIIRRALEALDD
jgi:hypothetical protein